METPGGPDEARPTSDEAPGRTALTDLHFDRGLPQLHFIP